MKKTLFLLLFISFLPLVDLLHTGIPRGHDTPDHVARIANFYQSLSEGTMIPRWAGNLNWGYGHPILMFLYPLPSYIASLFHAAGFTFVDSTKLVFAVSYVASVLAMFLFAKTAWGLVPGITAAVLYGFAPYRFVDLYVRGAIGEHTAFIFPPLIFYGLLRTARYRRSIWAGVVTPLAMAGLLLSHNAVAVMILPLIVLFIVYLTAFEAKDRIRFIVSASWYLAIGFLLSVFFWVPAYFEGKYTLRDIVTKGDMANRFVPWRWFFLSSWNYGGGEEFTKALGFAQWLAIGATPILFVRTKERATQWFAAVAVLLLVASLWLMTDGSAVIWNWVTIMQKFQFPWRFLTVAVFLSSLMGALTTAHWPKKFRAFFVFCLTTIAVVSTRSMWLAPEYLVKQDTYYSNIYSGTTDTGESSPVWSVRFMEQRPKSFYEVIEGEAVLVPVRRTATRHEFNVLARTDARIADNTLYFPGWIVAVDGRVLDPVRELIYQDPSYRGLMTFRVSPGDHRIVVSFGETKLRNAANLLSAAGLIILIFHVSVLRKLHVL